MHILRKRLLLENNMQIRIKKIDSIEKILRGCSYGRLMDRKTRQVSYARRLRGSLYPRFHIYVKQEKENLVINLHLDQRPTRYAGATAHSADYDGPVVEQEADRIKKFIKALCV